MFSGLGGGLFAILFESNGMPSGRLSISGTCLLFLDPFLDIFDVLTILLSLRESLSSLDIAELPGIEFMGELGQLGISPSGTCRENDPIVPGDCWLDD